METFTITVIWKNGNTIDYKVVTDARVDQGFLRISQENSVTSINVDEISSTYSYKGGS